MAFLKSTPEDKQVDDFTETNQESKPRKVLKREDLDALEAENERLRKRNNNLIDQIGQQFQTVISRLLNLPVGAEPGHARSPSSQYNKKSPDYCT